MMGADKSTSAAERPAAMVLEMFNGRAYVCESVEHAFRILRADAWACADQSKRAYMEGVAKRTLMWNKQFVRTDTVPHFMEDIERAGHITLRPLQ